MKEEDTGSEQMMEVDQMNSQSEDRESEGSLNDS